ncbi:D-amino acid dehydrogenase [Aureimonas endophytica]|uniref:D-amino acid dehydrogenase n=1 Tax=Aureimonas endophytica TaxID=2027858 RepID=A0A917A3W4_9HYPH|nr:D-amino acid dehydrogenase [Aureimonas endophytica]GGE25125.1 D-amino acid dehydrogenase [Aureimonas endophytica]
MTSVAVVGAGITGITTAYKLRQLGFDVTVFDRQSYAAMETSFANGGQLSASNAEVWNHPSTFLKGLKWMFRKDAPLLLHPTPSWHKLSWLAEFVAATRSYRENTVATVRLAIAAREHLVGMAEREGVDFDLVQRGILHVYETPAEFRHALGVNELLREGGLDRRSVTPDEIAAIEPAIKGRFHGGFFTESDFTGDIHKYTRGLADACLRQGVTFRYGVEIRHLAKTAAGIELDLAAEGTAEHHRFDNVVVCAGTQSRRFAAMLGDRVNIYPVKGYSVTVMLEDEASRATAPWVSILDDKAKIVTSRLGADRLRIAGTAEFAGENRDIRMDRIRPLVEWCRHRFPGVSTSAVIPWAGLRPMMPNMLPRVGAGRQEGVFYNTGHGHLGWTLSGITAEMVANTVAAATRKTAVPVGTADPAAVPGLAHSA